MKADFKCEKCDYIEKNIKMPNTGNSEVKRYVYINEVLCDRDTRQPIKEDNTLECSRCKGKMNKLIHEVPVTFSDNLIPNQGFSKVDKRHQLGMYHDAPKKISESKEVNEEARKSNVKLASKVYQNDKKVFDSKLKPMTGKVPKLDIK